MLGRTHPAGYPWRGGRLHVLPQSELENPAFGVTPMSIVPKEHCPMPTQRRNFTGPEKLAILREHLIDKVPICGL